MAYNNLFPSSSIHILLISSLLVPIAFSKISIKDYELHHSCGYSSGNLPSYYIQSRDDVLKYLISNAPLQSQNGFSNTTRAVNIDHPTYGMALCRGDVTMKQCAKCLNETKTAVVTYCPDSREAVILHNFCQLKYSDDNFFGFYRSYEDKFTEDFGDPASSTFYAGVQNLVSVLQHRASKSKMLFARSKEPIERKTVYAMVQCTRDLLAKECGSCIDLASKEDLSVVKLGGIASIRGCTIRYDVNPFLFGDV